jgi:polyhydroxyalkanoate synthesis regulator phasin
MRQTSSQWERKVVQSEANAKKMIDALLDYLVGQGDMSVSSAKNIVEEGMKQ